MSIIIIIIMTSPLQENHVLTEGVQSLALVGVFVEDPPQQAEDVVDDDDGRNKGGPIKVLGDQRKAVEAPHFG